MPGDRKPRNYGKPALRAFGFARLGKGAAKRCEEKIEQTVIDIVTAARRAKKGRTIKTAHVDTGLYSLDIHILGLPKKKLTKTSVKQQEPEEN